MDGVGLLCEVVLFCVVLLVVLGGSAAISGREAYLLLSWM